MSKVKFGYGHLSQYGEYTVYASRYAGGIYRTESLASITTSGDKHSQDYAISKVTPIWTPITKTGEGKAVFNAPPAEIDRKLFAAMEADMAAAI